MLPGHEQVVKVLFLTSLLERENAVHNDEENDCEGEHVDLSTVVSFALLDFWCHVGQGAAVALELVDGLVSGKAEVRNLHVQVRVQQNVLELQVSVGDTLSMHVLQSVEHLQTEKAASVLAHGAHQLAQVEEEAAGHMLHLHVDEVLDEAAGGLLHEALVAVTLETDDVRVLKVTQNCDF